MRKLLSVAFAVAGVVAVLVGPAPVAASNNDYCPNGWTRTYVGTGSYPDKNRNGYICQNYQQNGVTYKDDNLNAG
jgi:hypothetical protein